MERRALLIGGVSITVVILAALFAYFFRPDPYLGAVIDPPAAAAPISLTDSNGNAFQIESQRGKIVAIFFGYTNCPDECPLALAKLKQALGELGDKSKEVQVLLVTTDPVRDNAAVLKKYVTTFNPTFLGLTGSAEQLQTVYSGYGVAVMDGGQTHSSSIYVLDRSGRLRLTLPSDLEYQAIAHDLNKLLGEK